MPVTDQVHRFSTRCGCRSCRGYDAWDTMCACFCVLVIFTVCPVTVLLVMAANGVAGPVGGWCMAVLLAVSPVITWFVVRYGLRRTERP